MTKHFIPFVVIHLLAGCATQFEVPVQSFHGRIALSSQFGQEGTRFAAEHPRSGSALLLLHQGFDQIPNYRHYSLSMEESNLLQRLRDFTVGTKKFSRVEIIAQTFWDPVTLEEIQRMATLYGAEYVLIRTTQYDFNNFQSTLGGVFSFIPYINFVVPIHKLEASVFSEMIVFEVKSGAIKNFLPLRIAKKRRSSVFFMQDHYRTLSRQLHDKLLEETLKELKPWIGS